eukprot:s1594_g14.t1
MASWCLHCQDDVQERPRLSHGTTEAPPRDVTCFVPEHWSSTMPDRSKWSVTMGRDTTSLGNASRPKQTTIDRFWAHCECTRSALPFERWAMETIPPGLR